MAIAEMQKLTLIGFNAEREKLMRTLHRIGCTEIIRTADLDNAVYIENEEQKDVLQIKLARLTFAFDFINAQKTFLAPLVKKKQIEQPYPKESLLTKLEGNPSVTYEQFLQSKEKETEVFAVIKELEKLNEELQNIKSELIKSENLISQLEPFSKINIPLENLADTKNVSVIYGTIATQKVAALKTAIDAFPEIESEFFEGKTVSAAVFVCLKEHKDALIEKLSAGDFATLSLPYKGVAVQLIAQEKEKNAKANAEKIEIAERAVSYMTALSNMKLLYDFYSVELAKEEAAANMKRTSSTYIMEGWVPKVCTEKLEKTLKDNRLSLYFSLTEPKADDVPPTLAVNNYVVDSYESVTDMYSTPAYGELDPNPFVAFFYFLFFGIMMSDAMYGVILMLLSGAPLLIRRSKKGEDRLLKIIFMGGISTVIWGVLFGSYAGEESFAPLLFSPLGDPLKMMIMSLIFGALQMLVGIGLKAYILFKQKKPIDAIAESLPWFLLFGGIGVIAIGMLTGIKVMTTIAFVMFGLSVLGLLLAGARGKKGFKKFTGGFGNVYGIVGLISDLFSYTRLFGLGIATGVIAMVINEIAGIFISLLPIVGYVIAVAFLVFGHLFNISINTLGAYVHDARLQFVEFFGKFYVGGGELFAPLGARLKYYKIQK